MILRQYDLIRRVEGGLRHWIAWLDPEQLVTVERRGWSVLAVYGPAMLRTEAGVLVPAEGDDR